MKNNCSFTLALIIALAVMLQSLPARACAFDAQPYFTYSTHPDLPLDNYARGRLGILLPTYARSYLFVAYRYLSNQPLSESEQKVAVDLWNKRLTATDVNCPADTTEWLKARGTVPGVAKLESIETERPVDEKEPWQTYCNCQTAAFTTAAKTLKDLISKFGVDSSAVKE